MEGLLRKWSITHIFFEIFVKIKIFALSLLPLFFLIGSPFKLVFSIRLALARLLAQRAGTSLQMLIIDEGFGTQDAEGCNRLIAALNAIASDFACILAVTHMPQFKEAFQTRIEVFKEDKGSYIKINN